MKKKPAGRLNAITNNESFNSGGNVDDTFHYHFKLYVRWISKYWIFKNNIKFTKLKIKK